MLFPTLDFALFFLAVFGISWEMRNRPEARKVFLLGASYAFYAFWDWRFTALLAGSSLINYTAGRLLGIGGSPRERKLLVGIAVALNLAILGFFKYYGFFLDSLSEVLARAGLERDLPFLEIILPVGISFFTFQGISYVTDVYRGKVAAVDSPLDVFLYISFFPQLVAGPIVRAADFMPQLRAKPQLDRGLVSLGILLILVGLFKKMVIANYLATELVDQVFFDPGAFAGPDLALAIYAYAVQIYCDFSGYSDIAIGVAALLGYRFRWNFNQPYRAASLREFWHRWHISLSEWLRDYLYKPLGGSRGGTLATTRNLFLTMLLGGIWHGAAWTFVFWGLIHGTSLAVERLVMSVKTAPVQAQVVTAGGYSSGTLASFEEPEKSWWFSRMLGVLVTFHIVCLAWIFFRAESLDVAIAYLKGLGDWSGEGELTRPFLMALVAASLAAHFLPGGLVTRSAQVLEPVGPIGLGFLLGFGILLIQAIAPEGVAPFIYFQF
ncbi:MAG: MBOAT family protein [Hyphomicrobiaceae bacterium]|nr:MBOAT family protein [Hyphomicrobiaceae bacterium]